MFKDRVKIYQVYHSVISTALTWAVVLVINRYFDLRVHFWLGFIYCLIPAVLIYLFYIYRKNGISYLLLASIVPAMALVFWATKTNPVTVFNNILEWCRTYDWSDELYVAGYAHSIVFATAVI
jgi:phosphate starvation-inducible membrane PsiE